MSFSASVLPWYAWALLAAAFAALTAIFAKVGVEGVNADFATLVRTAVILVIAAAIVGAGGAWQPLATVAPKTWTFLALSGAATGLSWICYYRALQVGQASQVAPIDKLSIVLVAVFAAAFLGEKLSAKNWIGVLLIAGGALLVAAKR